MDPKDPLMFRSTRQTSKCLHFTNKTHAHVHVHVVILQDELSLEFFFFLNAINKVRK